MLLVPLDHQVQLVLQVVLEVPGLQVALASQVLLDNAELLVYQVVMGSQVILDLQVQRVNQVNQVSQASLVDLVAQD